MITKLVELIKFDEKIKIVDIGANPLLDRKNDHKLVHGSWKLI